MPIAVDSTFLYALGAGDALTLKVNEFLQNDEFEIFVTNTPLIELAAIDQGDYASKAPDVKSAVDKALKNFSKVWGIKVNLVASFWNGIAEETAKAIQLAFPTLHFHQALTIAEAATNRLDILLTWDSALLKIDQGSLGLFLKIRDLIPVTAVSPNVVMQWPEGTRRVVRKRRFN